MLKRGSRVRSWISRRGNDSGGVVVVGVEEVSGGYRANVLTHRPLSLGTVSQPIQSPSGSPD